MTHMYGKGKIPVANIQDSLAQGGHSLWRPGEQVRCNHIDCPAGEDKKQRLYVKRPADNAQIMIAYCHNCGCYGVVKSRASSYHSTSMSDTYLVDQLKDNDGNSKRARYGRHYQKPQAKWDGIMPAHWVGADELESWYAPAIQRCIRNGLTDTDLVHFEYHMDNPDLRMWHPIYSFIDRSSPLINDKALRLGMQGRDISRTRGGGVATKYLTTKRDADTKIETCLYTGTREIGGKMMVFCEDYISGIRLVQPGIAWETVAVPLLGSHIRTERMLELLSKHAPFTRVLIWLDNDKANIKDEAARMAGICGLVGLPSRRVITITQQLEPKHCTVQQLNTILSDTHAGTLKPGDLLGV